MECNTTGTLQSTPSECLCFQGYKGEQCEKNGQFAYIMKLVLRNWLFYVLSVVLICTYGLILYLRAKDPPSQPRGIALSTQYARVFIALLISTCLIGWCHYALDKTFSPSFIVLVLYPTQLVVVTLILKSPRVDPTFIRTGYSWCYYPKHRNTLKLLLVYFVFILVATVEGVLVLFYSIHSIPQVWKATYCIEIFTVIFVLFLYVFVMELVFISALLVRCLQHKVPTPQEMFQANCGPSQQSMLQDNATSSTLDLVGTANSHDKNLLVFNENDTDDASEHKSVCADPDVQVVQPASARKDDSPVMSFSTLKQPNASECIPLSELIDDDSLIDSTSEDLTDTFDDDAAWKDLDTLVFQSSQVSAAKHSDGDFSLTSEQKQG